MLESSSVAGLRRVGVAAVLSASLAVTFAAGSPAGALGAAGRVSGLRGALAGPACPTGTSVPTEGSDGATGAPGMLPAGLAAAPNLAATARAFGICLPTTHPDSALDIARFAAVQATRAGADSAAQLRLALAQRDALARQAA